MAVRHRRAMATQPCSKWMDFRAFECCVGKFFDFAVGENTGFEFYQKIFECGPSYSAGGIRL